MEASNDSIRLAESGILAKAKRLLRLPSTRSDGNILPLRNPPAESSSPHRPVNSRSASEPNNHAAAVAKHPTGHLDATSISADRELPTDEKGGIHHATNDSSDNGPSALPQAQDQGSIIETGATKTKPTLPVRFYRTVRAIILHSWVNVLLVFVPAGIVVQAIPGVHVGVVFALNCVAIVPLAGLLSHATESVACKLGDTVGALLNVTFGNAVELIIFIIALAKNEIRIVQASLLGSILANLLLILGMCFFLGGLRYYREQIYNSTVTQMSACLLSLSVISLVLPTAFHTSFSSTELADSESLKISRGCSIVLLLVYLVYLFFQLKSHAYMYESTPQHIVDAESTPGLAAAWLDTSSSDSSSTSSSDSDSSSQSRDTLRDRVKNVFRGGRGRKPSTCSSESAETANSRPAETEEPIPEGSSSHQHRRSSQPRFEPTPANDHDVLEHQGDDENEERPIRHRRKRSLRHKYSRKHRKGKRHARGNSFGEGATSAVGHITVEEEQPRDIPEQAAETKRVDFAAPENGAQKSSAPPRKPAAPPRRMSIKDFAPPVPSGPVPFVRYGIRRTNSLPDRLGQARPMRPPGAMLPAQIPLMSLTGGTGVEEAQHADDDEDRLSTLAAVILLVVSTGLVALCAEFVVDSINEVVEQGAVKEAFIGLIILPIVGNAAEHVTAITVALKNKMDLAIGVAVGSSIQIALFVTPLVVILGWAMGREMTLYFTLFETVCLFVSAFIVNFLVLDGRSNYLEGALLMSTYVIIGVVAFFYPNVGQTSAWGQGG